MYKIPRILETNNVVCQLMLNLRRKKELMIGYLEGFIYIQNPTFILHSDFTSIGKTTALFKKFIFSL